MKLSIIIVARDDAYGDDQHKGIYDLKNKPLSNIDRIKFCLENNLKLFEKFFKDEYEYVIVDWSPLNNKLLKDNSKIRQLFKFESIKYLIVTQNTVKQMSLNPNGFYEYIGKNYGIKNSTGEYILITNSDDYFNSDLIEEIKNEINKISNKNFYFRPHSRLDTNFNFEIVEEGLSFGQESIFDEIGTAAAGDFILSHRDNIIRIGQGFNEKTQLYFNQNLRQTAIDGALIINMYLNGIKPKKLVNSFNSFVHNKEERFIFHQKYEKYSNDKNWGELKPNIRRKIKIIISESYFIILKFLKKYLRLAKT